jgi:glycosyltransferase involved in cell wall biosynthesis
MKIVHVINTLAVGGAELHLLTLVRHLNQLGVENVVICLRDKDRDGRPLTPDFERENVKVINVRAYSRWNVMFPMRVYRAVKREQPDVLHTHLPRPHIAGYFAKWMSRSTPWVASVHNVYGNSWSGDWTLPLFSRVWKKPDQVIAISKAVKDWLVESRGIPEEKISVVYYGIEQSAFADGNGQTVASAGPNGQVVIGSIGRLEHRKGHDILIRAMPEVVAKVGDVRLLIAGHDPFQYAGTLNSIIRDLGLERNVELVGFQSDVPAFLNSLDVFAFASRAEGFGQVLAEAMASGTPVVATDISPINEVIKDGETGLLAQPNPEDFARKLVTISADQDAMRQMGLAGIERVKTVFEAGRMARETLAIYESVLKKASG